MAKVKLYSHIWGLKFNRSVCFSFHDNRTIFGWDIANSTFDLDNSRSSSWPRSNQMVTLRPKVQSICLLFVSWQSDHFLLRYSKFHVWPWKFMVKVMAKVKPYGHIWGPEWNRYVCFSLRGNRTNFWLRYSKFYVWPWKFKVKVMAKVKPDGHISGPEFYRYVYFSFRGNRAIFGWDIANFIFDLENWRSRSRRKSTKI